MMLFELIKELINLPFVKYLAFFFSIILLLILKILYDLKLREQDKKQMKKTDKTRIGKRFYIKRKGKEDVELNLYMRKDSNIDLPLIINIHGGAFIAGDADTLDTQSDRISRQFNSHIVNVNYKLIKLFEKGVVDVEYQTEEVVDTIKYFYENCKEYKIDINNIFVLGYSAGGFLAMNAALKLINLGIKIKGQILCYAFIKDIIDKFNKLDNNIKKNIPSALFILADNDFISNGSLDYEKILRENGINTEIKKYVNSKHGFIEENNPEYEKFNFKESKSPEQEIMARDAENFVIFYSNNYIIFKLIFELKYF